MRKAGDVILSGLLGCFVGTTYFLIEVVYKTARGHPQGISWTMLVLALLVGIIMERMGAELWCAVSGPVIVLLDWMRYAVRGGERPRYRWK